MLFPVSKAHFSLQTPSQIFSFLSMPLVRSSEGCPKFFAMIGLLVFFLPLRLYCKPCFPNVAGTRPSGFPLYADAPSVKVETLPKISLATLLF